MLSMSKDSGGNTAQYYEADNYYSQGGSAPSEWLGKGAEQAGLSGPVQADRFNDAREGNLPDGSQARDIAGKRTPGWDLTVSAPKSLSIMALVAGDTRLIEAHRDAAKTAASFVESQAATRIRYGKDVKAERTGNLVVGRYTHDTSRAGDPQLHDHLYIMNRTWHGPTQSWRAVESRSIYGAKEAAGRLYKAVLREHIEKLGYKTTQADKNGNFEIRGVGRALIETFSKRAETISQMAKGAHNPNARETRERIALMTRQRKDVSKSPAERREGWRRESGAELQQLNSLQARARLSSRTTAPIANLLNRAFPALASKPEDILTPQSRARTVSSISLASARAALQEGIDHIGQHTAVPTESDLLATVLQFAANTPARVDDILGSIADGFANGAFVKARNYAPGNFTTRTALDAEKDILSRMTSSQGSWRVLEGVNLRQAAALTDLSADQKNAYTIALGGNQRYASVVGYAGTGKSFLVKTMMETLAKHAEMAQLLVIAPKHEQVAQFQSELGAKADTVAHFLAANRHHLKAPVRGKKREAQDLSNTVLVVDEAGMLSNTDTRDLVQLADQLSVGRVIMMGDPRQKQSPEQGVPFQMGLKSGVSKVEMRDIRRQKSTHFLEAAKQAARGHTARALRTLAEHVHSTGPQKTMEKAAFEHWRGLSSDQRERALIVATTLERRDRLNTLIRSAKINDAALDPHERLGAEAHTHQVLVSNRLTSLQARTGRDIDRGDILIFHRNIRGAGIENGEQLNVVERARDGRSVTLCTETGEIKHYTFPGQTVRRAHFEAFTVRQMELRERDKLTWTKSDRQGGVRAGTSMSVLKIDRDSITVRDDDDREQTFERSDPRLQHLNYAYSSTSFAAQGQTRDVVIGVTGANDRYSGDQAHTYVLLSRVGAQTADQEHLAIYTDNADKLIERYNRELPSSDSALLSSRTVSDTHKDTRTAFAASAREQSREDRADRSPDALAVRAAPPSGGRQDEVQADRDTAREPGRGGDRDR
tara:strand:+ start:44463 stop:47456 length:2994 start_codon:yes stop_codon:yes gene_type:complete